MTGHKSAAGHSSVRRCEVLVFKSRAVIAFLTADGFYFERTFSDFEFAENNVYDIVVRHVFAESVLNAYFVLIYKVVRSAYCRLRAVYFDSDNFVSDCKRVGVVSILVFDKRIAVVILPCA